MSTALPAAKPKSPPPVVITPWRRFGDGLWRIPQGDIAAAYSADIFPKVKVFKHDGRLFMNGGCHFARSIRVKADCYPLVLPEAYSGPEKVEYSYEGETCRHGGKAFRLGPKTIFEADDPTVQEWRHHFKILYADGGMFATGVTYAEFLSDRLQPESPNEILAHLAEVDVFTRGVAPKTQAEMASILSAPSIKSETDVGQLVLF